jgi:hypothetical protein
MTARTRDHRAGCHTEPLVMRGNRCAESMVQSRTYQADVLRWYARTRLLSVMIFPPGHVLSWLSSRAAAGSG